MKFSLDKKEFVLYLVLILAFLYPGVTQHAGTTITFFRLFFLAVVFLALFRNEKHIVLGNIAVFILFITSITAYGFYGGAIVKFITFFSHIIFMYAVYLIMMDLRNKKDFENKFYCMLDWFTIICCFLWFAELILNVRFFPKAPYRECPNIFFTNENDFSTSLCAMGSIYLYRFIKKPQFTVIVKLLLCTSIIFIASARLSEFAIVLMIFLVLLLKAISLIKIHRGNHCILAFYLLLVSCMCITIFILCFGNKIILEGNSLYDLTIGIFKSIVNFTPDYNNPGSLSIRLSVMIIAIKELIKTGFWGIGLGNTQTIISELFPSDRIKSMHNMVVQLVVECGIWFLIPYLYFICAQFKRLWKSDCRNNIYLVRCTLLFALPLILAQSAGGIFANYSAWAMTLYMFLIP